MVIFKGLTCEKIIYESCSSDLLVKILFTSLAHNSSSSTVLLLVSLSNITNGSLQSAGLYWLFIINACIHTGTYNL